MDERIVTHWVSVKASILASAPPKRDPLPESFIPPKGTLASSETVCSLMWILPVSTRSASSMAMPTSPRMPRESPYTLSLTISAASSRVANVAPADAGPLTGCCGAAPGPVCGCLADDLANAAARLVVDDRPERDLLGGRVAHRQAPGTAGQLLDVVLGDGFVDELAAGGHADLALV